MNNISIDWWLKRHLLLKFWRLGSPRSDCRHSQAVGEGSLHGLQTAAFCLYSPIVVGKGKKAKPSHASSHEGFSAIMGPPPSWPKAPSSNPMTLGLRVSTYEHWEGYSIQSAAPCCLIWGFEALCMDGDKDAEQTVTEIPEQQQSLAQVSPASLDEVDCLLLVGYEEGPGMRAGLG